MDGRTTNIFVLGLLFIPAGRWDISISIWAFGVIYHWIDRFFLAPRREAKTALEAELKAALKIKREEEYQQQLERISQTPGPRVIRPRDWKSRREFALRRDGNKCKKCGSTLALHVHHVEAASASRDHSGTNLVTLCIYCHAEQPGRGHGKALLSRTLNSRMKKHRLVRHKSRKMHQCDSCKSEIQIGEFNYLENYQGGRKLCERCVFSLTP